jgi:[acyl-carrier-protein] S-malonyltransferase
MVAGHSLGEISALTVAGALSFEDGLKLVAKRAEAMQKACEANPSGMAAIIGMDDNQIIEVCEGIDSLVIAANFNSPGQVVISGTNEGVDEAVQKLSEAGAKRAIKLAVGGAFHSPLMEPARMELEKTLSKIEFKNPRCPVYQNVDGLPSANGEEIKEKLNVQMVSPVLWTKTIENMLKDKAGNFVESGPGKVLQGLIKKIDRKLECSSL